MIFIVMTDQFGTTQEFFVTCLSVECMSILHSTFFISTATPGAPFSGGFLKLLAIESKQHTFVNFYQKYDTSKNGKRVGVRYIFVKFPE